MGMTLGINALNASTPSTATSAPQPQSTPSRIVISSEPAQGRATAAGVAPKGNDIKPPVLGQGADEQTLNLIREGLDPVLAKFPKGDKVSVALLDPSGKPVTGFNQYAPLMPASTIKVATGSALWNTFGPDYHFSTKLMARGDISPEGTLNGDLYLVGDGDPSLMSELAIAWKVRPPRPTLSMGTIAEAARKLGIKSISGSVVGVDNIFHGDQAAKGWKDSYFAEQNATHIHALSVDRGRVIIPKEEKGTKKTEVEKAVYHPTQVGQSEPDAYQTITSPDTRLDAAAALTQSLSARGITVAGVPGTGAAVPADAKEIAKVQGPALRQMVDWIEQRSDNHMADMLIRRMDVENGGDGSFSSAASGVIDHMEKMGIDTAEMVMEDGSGLSRDDRVTAEQLAQIVLHMAYTDPDWLGTLSVLGESGTTANRLKNTPAQGRWHGKTGSLDDVVSYVGAIKDRQNNVWTLAMMANGKSAHGFETTQDELLLAIANLLVPPPNFTAPKV